MARPRCFLSEGNPYDVTITLLKNLCLIRTLQQSAISPNWYPNWTLPQMCSWDSFDRKWVDWCPSQTSQFKFCLIYPNCPSNSIGITLAQSTNPLSAEDGPDPLPLYGLVKRSDGWSAKNGLVNQAQYNRKLLIYSRCLEYPKLIFSDYPLWKTSDLFFPPRLK